MAQAKHLHEKRGITFQALGALLGTRELLARGLMERSENSALFRDYSKHSFNMGVILSQKGCGSVSCIGGTMLLIMGRSSSLASIYENQGVANEDLHELFFPCVHTSNRPDYTAITVAQSVQAIDNYLETGKPQWARVLDFEPVPKVRLPRKPQWARVLDFEPVPKVRLPRKPAKKPAKKRATKKKVAVRRARY